MYIIFSGTDGAGKSTQISKLNIYFGQDKTRVVWSRGGYTPFFKFIKFCIKICGRQVRYFFLGNYSKSNNNTSRNAQINDIRSRFFKYNFVVSIWLSFSILDLILFYGIYLRFLKFKGYIVICDRYIDDTMLDFCLNFPIRFKTTSFLWKLLKFVTPTPNYSFLLYVTPELSIERAILKNDPFPDTYETLQWRFSKYMDNSIFCDDVYTKIDCQNNIDFIHNKIISRLQK